MKRSSLLPCLFHALSVWRKGYNVVRMMWMTPSGGDKAASGATAPTLIINHVAFLIPSGVSKIFANISLCKSDWISEYFPCRNQNWRVFEQHRDLWDPRLVSCGIQQEADVRLFVLLQNPWKSATLCHDFNTCSRLSVGGWGGGYIIFHGFYLFLMKSPGGSACFAFVGHTAARLFHPQRASAERGWKLHHLHQEFHQVSKVWVFQVSGRKSCWLLLRLWFQGTVTDHRERA